MKDESKGRNIKEKVLNSKMQSDDNYKIILKEN